MNVAERIEELGTAAVAAAAGLSRGHVINVLAGRDRLSGPLCVAVADACGLDVADVAQALGGELAALRAALAVARGDDVRAALTEQARGVRPGSTLAMPCGEAVVAPSGGVRTSEEVGRV